MKFKAVWPIHYYVCFYFALYGLYGCHFLIIFWLFIYGCGFAAIARTVGHLSKSAEVMKLVNDLMKAPEMAATMQEFSKEMTKVSFLSQKLQSFNLFLDSMF